MSGPRHSWALQFSFPERTARRCRRCGLVRMTVREPDAPASARGLRDRDGNLFWTEYHLPEGGVANTMPACVPAESEAA